MYHDDREIDAEKMAELLERRVQTLTQYSAEPRLLLMVILVALGGEVSPVLHALSHNLKQGEPSLDDISTSELKQLLFETKQILAISDDISYLLTHLAAKAISLRLGLDYRHPKLVAAFVGTVQSTLSTSLFEVIPNTAELSLGLLGTSPKNSFQMRGDISESHRDLISIRLAAVDVIANFTTSGYHPTFESTILLDAPNPISTNILAETDALLEHIYGRLVLIKNWSVAEQGDSWKELLNTIKHRGEIEAIINFSSFPLATDQHTVIIINTKPIQRETLYINVSSSNKSLPPLDGIERMLLAGCIYNLWQGRTAHGSIDYLSENVSRFLNSYFSEGFRPIVGLCNALDRRPKSIPKTRLVSQAFLKAAPGDSSRPAQTNNSSMIREMLERDGDRCCIYIIGDNGEGKSFLLRDVVYQLDECKKRSIGLPMSHADRFPVKDKKLKQLFEYKGTRKNQILKEVSAISSQPRKMDLLSDCLEIIGFSGKIYLTLKSELSYNRLGELRRKALDLGDEDDMEYFNRDKGSVSQYEVNFIRKGHRTILFNNLSSGEQSILSLLIKIIASNTEQVTFLIDEPEISLHVSWQQKLPRILSLLSSRLDVSFIVATHSPILIANAADKDICCVLRIGKLEEVPVDERHSVETLLMDGFRTYTPRNREVHERCAKLVASLISSTDKTDVSSRAEKAITKLESFRATIKKNSQAKGDSHQANDLDLVEKALGAISMLRDQSRPHNG